MFQSNFTHIDTMWL